MSPEAHAILVELDAVSRAAREFYDYASAVLPASTLRSRCQRLARAKSELVAVIALRLQHPRVGAPPQHRLLDRISSGLGRVRSGLATPEPAWLGDELERMENAIVEHYEHAAAGSDDVSTRCELMRLLPLLQRCRSEISSGSAADPNLGAAYSM